MTRLATGLSTSLLIAAAVTLGACGGSDNNDNASTTTGTTQSTTTQSTTGTTTGSSGGTKTGKGKSSKGKKGQSGQSGGSSAQTETQTKSQPTGTTPTGTAPKPSDVDPFKIAKNVCGTFLPETIARDIKKGKITKKKVAKDYSKGYPTDQRTKAYKGCLAGLKGRQ
jgi:hypothetical protein